LCGICRKKGHNRNTCLRQFGINTAFYNDEDMVLNRMGKTLVLWQLYKIIRNRPSEGRTCTYCGALGHNRRKCPWRNDQGRNLQNVAEIRAAAKKYFEALYYPIRMCGWCGAIGHNRKNCPVHKARGAEIDNDHKRVLIE
ncbi:6040_t:CDS:1, partial [Dentiscutata erythropus]